MNELKKEILLTAINGLESENYKAALEKIMMLVTLPNKQWAYQKALEIRAEARKLVTIEDVNIKNYKAKYGYYKKIPVIQLALDYVQMPTSFFKEKYGFIYIPKENVIQEVKELIAKIQIDKKMLSIYGSQIESTFKSFMNVYA